MTTLPDGSGDRQNDKHDKTVEGAVAQANWGLAFDLGIRLGGSIVIGVVLGYLADNWLKTNPLLTLIGLGLGVAAAFYTIWDVAKRSMHR